MAFPSLTHTSSGAVAPSPRWSSPMLARPLSAVSDPAEPELGPECELGQPLVACGEP